MQNGEKICSENEDAFGQRSLQIGYLTSVVFMCAISFATSTAKKNINWNVLIHSFSEEKKPHCDLKSNNIKSSGGRGCQQFAMQSENARYATVKTVSKPMAGFLFFRIQRKKSHRKTIEAPKRNRRKCGQSGMKERETPPSHGLVINSHKTTMLAPKRACSDADVTCHCQIETRFYPCLLTSHTQWVSLSPSAALCLCILSVSQRCGWQWRKSTNIYNTHSQQMMRYSM